MLCIVYNRKLLSKKPKNKCLVRKKYIPIYWDNTAPNFWLNAIYVTRTFQVIRSNLKIFCNVLSLWKTMRPVLQWVDSFSQIRLLYIYLDTYILNRKINVMSVCVKLSNWHENGHWPHTTTPHWKVICWERKPFVTIKATSFQRPLSSLSPLPLFFLQEGYKDPYME